MYWTSLNVLRSLIYARCTRINHNNGNLFFRPNMTSVGNYCKVFHWALVSGGQPSGGSKILVGGVSLPLVAGLHGRELSIPVKLGTAGKKTFKISLKIESFCTF